MVVSTDGAYPGVLQAGTVDEEASRVVDAARGGGLEGVLAPYPSQHHQGVWAALTSYITPALLSQLSPPPLSGGAAAQRPPPPLPSPPGHRASSAHTTLDPPPTLHFTPIPGGMGPGVLPSQRTSHAMDTSQSFYSLMGAAKGGWRGVLGEVQASFIGCLLGQSYECLVAWKALVDTILRAEDALVGGGENEKEAEAEVEKEGGEAGGGEGSAAGGATPCYYDFWEAALGSVVPAQIGALGEGVEGVEDGKSVVAQGLSSLVVSGERWLKEGRGPGRVQRAIGTLLGCSVGRVREGGGEGGFWKAQDATLGGAFSLAHVKALVKRLLGKGGPLDGGGTPEAAAAPNQDPPGFATLAELLRDLEIQGGDGDLPTFVA